MLTPVETWNQVKELPLTQLDGGVFELPIAQLKRLYQIPWTACRAEAHPSVRLSPAHEFKWSSVEAIAEMVDEDLIVGHNESGARWQSLRDIDDLSTLLVDLKDGTELELFTSGEEQGSKQRYRGTVTGGIFTIDSTQPAMNLEVLTRAYEFVGCKDERLSLPSAEVAAQAALWANEDLGGTYMGADSEGCEFWGVSEGQFCADTHALVLPYAFAAMFKDGPWALNLDFGEEDDDTTQLLQRLSAAMTSPDPKGERLVLSGDYGRFFTGRLTSLDHVIDEDVLLLDEEMTSLGYQPLGDLTCNKIPGTVLRGYAGHDGYSIGMASQASFFVEFYTAFQDSSSITTTTNAMAGNIKKKKIFRKAYTHLEPEGLFEEHRRAVDDHGQKVVAGPPTLEGLARAIDEYMVRQGDSMW